MPLNDKEKRQKYNTEYHKKWYSLNKDKKQSQVKVRRDQNIKLYEEFKTQQTCCKCGNSDHRVLEFHHVDPLNDKNSRMRVSVIARDWPTEKLLEYIKKETIVVCANCHKILHYKS